MEFVIILWRKVRAVGISRATAIIDRMIDRVQVRPVEFQVLAIIRKKRILKGKRTKYYFVLLHDNNTLSRSDK